MPRHRKNIMDEIKDIDNELLYGNSSEDTMYENDTYIEKLRQQFETERGYELLCLFGEIPLEEH